MRSKRLAPLAATTAVALSAIAVAACGSGSSSKQPTTGASAPAASSATVDLAKASLGPILIDSHGRTLYLWQADTGAKSTCTGACASAWPPLVTT
ncbi:MAG: hypothetical protein QOD24_479, partial [Solirubrobacteraceae bacterium]|nr:hypothetical protein [Solirubrobacteraceae bacterium]